jgi:Domain of unknown function (DUF1929)/Abnormal spindle-like microcephaly-assoc'd, ASPM-SPD-2-Hydin
MQRMNRTSLQVVICLLFAGLTGMAARIALSEDPSLAEAISQMMGVPDETDRGAPVDYGPGPGIKPRAEAAAVAGASAPLVGAAGAGTTIPTGSAAASTAGVFGAAVTWPLIAIHVVLLPDGRVMSYGTGATGKQGAQFIYDVWDPSQGTGSNSHTVLPNTTGTDIFCGAQSLMLNGEVLTSGGDLTVNGARNSANNNTTLFSPTANTLTSNTPMTYARWYGTLLALPNGQLAVFGGRQNVGQLSPIVPAPTPELYDPGLRTWTSLTGATSIAAFGANWFYPRVFVAPGGSIFALNNTNGRMFFLSTANGGGIKASTVTAPNGNAALPTVPFTPGKVLSVRLNQEVVTVDYRTSTPVVAQTDPIDQARFWASGTVLADGRVLITGGSAVANKLTNVDYQAQIWDPATGHWTAGASASKPRLYHSNALLLSDATVLTAGGGAPGPVTNLNAEIYYPPYLYNADGTLATRPIIVSTDMSTYDPGETLNATVGPTDEIARLTLVRTGSATHANDADQRFIELGFTQAGQTVTTTLPSDTSVLIPGYYLLFAINTAGVPSVATIFPVTANIPAGATFALAPATVTFGIAAVGAASAAQPVTLTNSGGTLPQPTITFTGPGASQFSQTNTCGNSIAAGATCSINVVYTPSSAGYTFATLDVTASGVTQTAAVNGTGSVPFAVTPATVSFGTMTSGSASAPQAITVTNAGSAALPVSSITLTGSAPSQFSQTNNCGTPVAPGSTCTINVVFTPGATGYIWAKVNVNAPGATHSSTVSGHGG